MLKVEQKQNIDVIKIVVISCYQNLCCNLLVSQKIKEQSKFSLLHAQTLETQHAQLFSCLLQHPYKGLVNTENAPRKKK